MKSEHASTDGPSMSTRTKFGMHLSTSSGLLAVYALALVLLGGSDWLTGIIVTAVGGLFLLTGMWLVVSRGDWSSTLTSSEIRQAAFFGAAYGPAAALGVALFVWWPLSVVALPLPALLAVLAVSVWRILPEPLRAFVRFFRHFS